MPDHAVEVSIVIPVHNALALTRECVRSIETAGARLSYEIIVMDNGSAPDVEAWARTQRSPHFHYLRDPEPLGFARAVNRGAARAGGETLIILNSDTVVTPGWMEALHDALLSDPSLGALTPSTNAAGDPAQMDFATVERPLEEALAIRAAQTRAPNLLYLPQRITFFCAALRRSVWQDLGGLDEAYPIGNFEDDDLCLRLRVAGYRLAVAQHAFVYHHNNATFKANGLEHGKWMSHNATVFAGRARALAEATDLPAPRWPKRAAHEISVIVHPRPGQPLERTLRSLGNQTVQGFEVVHLERGEAPSRAWCAHVAQGDLLYPFHLEALLEAAGRMSVDAICSDAWNAVTNEPLVHPDSVRPSNRAAQLLPGSLHHSSVDPDALWEQTTPLHWPRLTWESSAAPVPPPAPPRTTPVDHLRDLYRRVVPLRTRHAIDAGVRRALRLPAPTDRADAVSRESTGELEALLAAGAAAGQFSASGHLAPVVQFNAVTWHSATQRQHHFARGLARLGHPVLWIETDLRPARHWWTGRAPQEVAPGVYLLRLPGSSREIYHLPWTEASVDAMSAALRLTASAFGFSQMVTLVNYPRWQPIVARLREQAGWSFVYDCLDDQSALADLYQTDATEFENRLMAEASHCYTSSVLLHERFGRRPTLLHNGADFRLFSEAAAAGHLTHLPRPIVGFFGALADWLDMDLIRAAAQRFPHYSFVYIGPQVFSSPATEARWRQATNLPNVTLIPQVDPPTLAAHLAEFDVCTMPFVDIPVTRAMNAVKLYEYLAAGKPVVARSLPEVRHLVESGAPLALYRTPEEFFAALGQALTQPADPRRQEFARRNDWSQRVSVLSAGLGEVYETSSSSASSSGAKTRSQE